MTKLRQLLLAFAMMVTSIIALSALTATPASAAVPSSCTQILNNTANKWPELNSTTSYLYNCYSGDPQSLASNLMPKLQLIPNSALIGSGGKFLTGPVQVFVFHTWADYQSAFSGAELPLAPSGLCTGGAAACSYYSSSATPNYYYVIVVANPDGHSSEISMYDSWENTLHELGHVLDFMLGSPSSNTASSYFTLVEHDLLNLDYKVISSSKATSKVRTPCNSGDNLTGPFQGLTDPDTNQPFCTYSGVGSVWNIEGRFANMSNSEILQTVGVVNGTPSGQFAYLFATTPQYFELFADQFYWAGLADTGNPPSYPEPWNQTVRLFLQPNPAFITCSEGYLKSEWTGNAVTPPAACTNAIPGWYVPYQSL